LELKTKKELSQHSHTLARSFNLVRHRGVTYVPVDFETGERDPAPAAERTVWIPLSREDIMLWARDQFSILFGNDGELASFDFMVAQNSIHNPRPAHSLLVRTDEGLRELRPDGQLHPTSGNFIPNTLAPTMHTDKATKKRVFDTVAEWLDSEDEAHALLRHLATALAPGWTPVKYVLLLGEGRNGKGLLLKMIQAVIGRHNVSSVTRQHMAEQSPVVCELNNKLVNIVFDGRAEYVKDSGTEKTLVAGEPAPIRRLYESTPTMVQTNALFLEALNHEPKSRDKSLALQKRIIRFQFPNVYALDHGFERTMLSDNHLGAFMSLLIDHYVLEHDVAKALAPTTKSMELQLEHMFVNSLGLQYLKYMENQDALGAGAILGQTATELAAGFQGWRLKENDLTNWPEPDVLSLFQPILNTDRKGVRVDGKPRKVRVVTGFKDEAKAFIETLKGEDDDLEALVAE
jgi:hypothetical protein